MGWIIRVFVSGMEWNGLTGMRMERMGLYYNVMYSHTMYVMTGMIAWMFSGAVISQSVPGKQRSKRKPRPVSKAGFGDGDGIVYAFASLAAALEFARAIASRPFSRFTARDVSSASMEMNRTLWSAACPSCER